MLAFAANAQDKAFGDYGFNEWWTDGAASTPFEVVSMISGTDLGGEAAKVVVSKPGNDWDVEFCNILRGNKGQQAGAKFSFEFDVFWDSRSVDTADLRLLTGKIGSTGHDDWQWSADDNTELVTTNAGGFWGYVHNQSRKIPKNEWTHVSWGDELTLGEKGGDYIGIQINLTNSAGTNIGVWYFRNLVIKIGKKTSLEYFMQRTDNYYSDGIANKDGLTYKTNSDGTAYVIGYDHNINISKITIPETASINGTKYFVSSIAANAFSGCQTIESVTIEYGVRTIGERAFYNCHSLKEIIIGESVQAIGNKAFRGCHKLRSVEVPTQVSSVGEDAFLYVKNVDYRGGIVDGAPWSALTLNGTKDGDFIYSDAEKTNLTAYIGDGGFAVIPKGVTSIGFMSFFESDNLESVSIPNTVTSIGGSAFANCFSLKTINVPLSVQMISRAAFRDCRSAVIYCEAPSQPYSWHKEWSYKANNILWGQTNPPVAINDELATGVVIYAEGRTIVVENATDEISVYDVMGRIVGRDVARNVCTIAINKPGVYIVKTGATVKRVVVK